MSEKDQNFISVVIYIHNDEKYLKQFLEIIGTALEAAFLHSEIICVNDYSKDKSIEIIREFGKNIHNISLSILNMSYYHGLELSMSAGMDLSIGDFVFEFDSVTPDFEVDTILSVYKKSLQGFDIVSAVPERTEIVSSRIFYYLFNKFNHRSCRMMTERFRILSRRVINRISSMNKTIFYRKAIYMNCGLPTTALCYKPMKSIPVKRDTQEHKYRVRLAVDAMLLFTDIGYRISAVLTSIMIIVALLTGIYAACTYIVSIPVAGWTTTMLFLSFSFGGLFGILTLIIKYLQIILNLVFTQKSYSFEGIEKITNE